MFGAAAVACDGESLNSDSAERDHTDEGGTGTEHGNGAPNVALHGRGRSVRSSSLWSHWLVSYRGVRIMTKSNSSEHGTREPRHQRCAKVCG